MKSKVWTILSLLLLVSMMLAACQPTEVIKTVVVEGTPQVIEKTVEVEKVVEKIVTPTAQPTTRKGGWLDQIIFSAIPDQNNGIAQLEADSVDVYAVTIDSNDLFKKVTADTNLTYNNSYGSFDAFLFNPAGPTFSDGRLNPFSNPKIREAMNWLIDRKYIAEEIVGVGAKPKTVVLVSAFPDYALYADIIRPIEAKYAFNVEKAKAAIQPEMEAMGATLVDGKWQFNGAPVSVKALIRTEDERRGIGNYFADQLEAIGFTVERMERVRSEAAPLWQSSVPAEGQWSFYTAGWGYGNIVRDMGIFFDSYYNPRGDTTTTQQAFVVSPEFDAVSLALATNDFSTTEERRELFKTALNLSVVESQVVFAVDLASFTARNARIETAYDLSGGINFSTIWPYTMRMKGQEGGFARIAQSGVLVSPWNPVAGSNWVDDQMVQRATADDAFLADPYTGLPWPNRMEKMEVVAQKGLPMTKTLDWVTLDFVDKIDVPADAWADWDAKTQKFITVAEKYPDGVSSLTKTTIYYPSDMFKTVTWHDGSPISVGDFVNTMIALFDNGKADSAIYDEAQVPTVDALLTHFKGVRIVSRDPLVIETYDDLYAPDAELMAGYNYIKWFPTLTYGPLSWHTFGLGYLGEVNQEIAFSADKATAINGTWTGYLTGPSLDVLKKYLDQATVENYIPYAPTLSQFITAEEATLRYKNLAKWYEERGHFYLGTGPYYVSAAYPTEGTLVLKRYEAYPDIANRWDRFANPRIAVADVSGPAQLTMGQEATFDVFVTYNDAPYAITDIKNVIYLLYDSNGTLVANGLAEAVVDGQYQTKLDAETTNKLTAGACKIEMVVVPNVVSIPTFSSIEFNVVAP